MKHPTLLLAVLLLLLVPRVLHAHDYEDPSVRFTIPADYAVEEFRQKDMTGFSAEKKGLKMTFFNLPVQRIRKRDCLKLDDANWLPSLKGRKPVDRTRYYTKRYDLATVYRDKTSRGYVKIYRYVTVHNIGMLIAESSVDRWDEADAVAGSQSYKKSFKFYLDNFETHLINFVIWTGVLIGMVIFTTNTIRKFRRKGYFLYLLLIVVIGLILCLMGLTGTLEQSIAMVFFASVLFSAIYGSEDAMDGKPAQESCDADLPDASDGTGTTIHYDV